MSEVNDANDAANTRGAEGTTPLGETGTNDIRGPMPNAVVEDESRDESELSADPTAEDPYGTPAAGRKVDENDPGPSYEPNAFHQDMASGGSLDPNNNLTHANSGDDTDAN